MKQNFLFIGHRGTRIVAENTFYAFEKAIEYGATHIEFDVRKTFDNKLIVIHDASLERTTKSTGYVKDRTYEELKDIKSKLGGQKIPLFSEVVHYFKKKINFMIELKVKDIGKEILKIISENDLIENSIFSGRLLDELILIKKEYPESRICYNITKAKIFTLSDLLNLDLDHKMIKYPFDMISLRSSLVTSKFIRICHRNNVLALSWDFLNYEKPLNKIRSLVKMGIDGILFDNYLNIPLVKKWFKNN
jgi:glycerophosphoryl diester phosphodiesterase